MDIKEIGKKYKDYVIEKRRHFHENPEPSLHEFETSRYIKAELDSLGIPYETFEPTGIYATIKGKNSGKTVLLRADMDALEVCEKNDIAYKSKKEGYMHACGHDGHTAMLLGAVKILNDIKNELNGDVKILFQPAEEVAQGAKDFLKAKPIKGKVDGAFAIHLWSDIPTGKISLEKGIRMGAADNFFVKIKGVSGHASMPHQTIDATVVAAAVVMNIQSLVSRNVDPTKPLVVTVGQLHSGTRTNVISAEATLDGTVRCFDEDVYQNIPDMFERVVKNTCEAYGATCEIDFKRMIPPLVNDANISEILAESAVKLFGNSVIAEYEKTGAAEDFACISREVPSSLAFVGIKNKEKGSDYPHHSNYFNIDEDALEIGTDLYAQFAYDFLNK